MFGKVLNAPLILNLHLTDNDPYDILFHLSLLKKESCHNNKGKCQSKMLLLNSSTLYSFTQFKITNSQNLKQKTWIIFRGSSRNTRGNRRDTRGNKRKHHGKRQEMVRKQEEYNIKEITIKITQKMKRTGFNSSACI